MLKTLKGKISFVYIGLVLLIALVGGVSAFNTLLLRKSVNGLMAENYISISAMERAENAINEQNIAILQYLELNDETGINQFFYQSQLFQKSFQRERNNVTEHGEQAIVDSINTEYNEWSREFSLFINNRDLRGKPAASEYYKATMKNQYNKICTQLDKITTINQNAMLQKKSNAASSAGNSLCLILVLSMLAVTGGFLLSRYLVNRFLQPVHLLTENISQVSAGKLEKALEVKTGDEIEKLVHEFNSMIERLSAYEQSTMGTLMEEKNRSVNIVKSISDPLIVLDRNYKVIMVNKACEEFFDFEEEKSLGKHFLESIRDGELFNFITASMESKNLISEKVLYFEKDKDYYFNVSVTKNDTNNRQNKGCIVLMQNVTGFKELERIKTDFVATVSHEFKTPLTSIIMGASMLEGGNLGILGKEQKTLVDTIIEDGERLSGFVNELLEVSKLESGKAVYSFEPCSISAIAENSIRQFTETAQRENVALVNDIDENLPFVYADFERITWVLNNLLSNALKYTTSGDFITLSAIVNGPLMEVTVKDTGDGIPQEYLDRIFDKFVQVKGHDIEARGTGLGLAVSKEIVMAHRGNISVESELDAGSTFRFTLPLAGQQSGEAK